MNDILLTPEWIRETGINAENAWQKQGAHKGRNSHADFLAEFAARAAVRKVVGRIRLLRVLDMASPTKCGVYWVDLERQKAYKAGYQAAKRTILAALKAAGEGK